MDEDENKKIAYYARFLLDGGNVKNVPVSSIPKIKIVLTISKKKAISKGQTDTVKKIQSILSDLELAENRAQKTPKNIYYENQSIPMPKMQGKYQQKKPQSSLSLYQNNQNLPQIQRSQSRQINKRNFPDEELEKILQCLINGSKNEIEIDIIPELIQFTKQKINNLVNEDKLIEAQKYETINQQLISSSTSRYKHDLKSNKKKEYISQLQAALDNLQEEQSQMELELSAYDESINQLRNQHEFEWNKQLIEFDEITNGDVPSNYKRFSQKLISLREQTKSLIKSRHFEEAGLKKMEADELEQYELLQCKENYINARQKQRERLISNHNQKMNCFEENYTRNRLKIIKDYQYIITCIERTISNLQTKINNIQTNSSENTVYIKTPVSTPLHSAPLSPHHKKNKNATFITQSSQLASNSTSPNSTLPKTAPNTSPMTPKSKPINNQKQNSDTKIMYRQIPSKWRFQTPQLMRSIKKNVI